MQKPTTQWRVSAIAWIPVSIAIIAESAANALRAYGLGSHLERYTVHVYGHDVSISGAVLVLAAVAVSLTQARAAWVMLSPSRPVRQRLVAGFGAALLLAISVSAMASHILEATRAKVADEYGDRGRHDRTKLAYDSAQAELQALGQTRAVSVIKAEIDVPPATDLVAWRRSNKCLDVTRVDTAAVCAPYATLYRELASSERKTVLGAQVESLRIELAKLARPEEVSDSEGLVAFWWAWIMGLGVVFIATFGTVIFARSVDVPAVVPVASVKDLDDREQFRPRPDNEDEPGPMPRGGGITTKAAAERDLVTHLAFGNSVPSQDSLAFRWNVGKGTVSKWVSDWERNGTIPQRTQVGRCKTIASSAMEHA